MLGILNKLIGDSNDKALKQLQPVVDEINALEDEFQKMSLDQIKDLTEELRQRYRDGACGGRKRGVRPRAPGRVYP